MITKDVERIFQEDIFTGENSRDEVEALYAKHFAFLKDNYPYTSYLTNSSYSLFNGLVEKNTSLLVIKQEVIGQYLYLVFVEKKGGYSLEKVYTQKSGSTLNPLTELDEENYAETWDDIERMFIDSVLDEVTEIIQKKIDRNFDDFTVNIKTEFK